jgi:hypothetical protein
MLFSRQASGAVLADTRTASQAERAKNGGPEALRLILKPTPDIGIYREQLPRCPVALSHWSTMV